MCDKRLSIAVVVVTIYAGLVALSRPFIAFGETVLTASSSLGGLVFGIIRLTHNGCGLCCADLVLWCGRLCLALPVLSVLPQCNSCLLVYTPHRQDPLPRLLGGCALPSLCFSCCSKQ